MPRTRCVPLPLVGRGRGGGRCVGQDRCIPAPPPLPNPPPQGGREQTEFAARASQTRCSMQPPRSQKIDPRNQQAMRPASVRARGGGRSRGTTICPHGTSREFGPNAIAQSRHGSVNSPARCGPRRRKRSGSSGGTCAIGFPLEAHISVAKFELAATSSTLVVTRGALLSRLTAASMERNQPPMTTAREFSRRTAIACCAIGTMTCCRISMACSRTF